MRRLRRIFLNTFTAFSLLLCLAAMILWLRSYSLTDQLSWAGKGGPRTFYSASGHLAINLLFADWSPNPTYQRPLHYEQDVVRRPFNYLLLLGGEPNDIDTSHEWLGFAWYSKSRGTYTPYINVVIPFWSLVTITALLPLSRVASALFRRHDQRAIGHCIACGYDLRASPDRCPECGTVTRPSTSLPIVVEHGE